MQLNTKYKYLLVITIFLISNYIKAQQSESRPAQGNKSGANGTAQSFGVISGTLNDESTKEHVEYGNILLFKAKDSTMVTGTITDAKGKFLFSNVAPGSYYLRVSFIGYEDKYYSGIAISQRSADVKMGNLSIKPKMSGLQEVEIIAEKSLITNNLDKKVITVDKTMALSGGTATDIMENVPSVAVDAEGNVSMRGNSNITLLIDGKPASQAGISSSDILNQLPASAIESIEVITNPSVRYDPDGTSGIINIVLKKKALQGFNGQVSGTVGTNEKYNGSLNLNYRANKVNFFVGADGRYNLTETSSESERTSKYSDFVNILRQTQEGESFRKSMNVNGGIDYFIDTRNNITFSVQKRNMAFGQKGFTSNKNYYGSDSLMDNYTRFTDSERKIQSMGYNLSYKHTFAEKGREFTQDFVFYNNEMNNEQLIDQQNIDPVTNENIGLLQSQKNYATNNNIFFTAQGNYIHPFVSGARLETGYKVSLRDMGMDYDYTTYNHNTNEWEEQVLLKNHYDYKEQIYAVYGIYGNTWKKLRYQAGLRYEQVYNQSKVEQTGISYTNPYSSFYPSLHTQYDLGKKRELQFSYSRRVDRPSPRELNPYVDYSDSLNIRQGNPALQPEYTNSLEVGVLKYWDKTSLTSNLFFRNTAGLIEDITLLDTTGISYTMPQNINNSKSYGIEFVASANPNKWLRLNGNLSFYNYMVSEVPEYHIPATESFTWSGRLNATFMYSKDGSFQLIGNYMSPSSSLQSTRESNYNIDASLRHDFFKSKLTVSLRVTDIFNTRNFNSVTTGNNFVTVNNRYMESRVLYAGIQLKLNNYSKKSEKNSNGEMQDDGF
jgi:outer membrane receptor protein involved in Fe transport